MNTANAPWDAAQRVLPGKANGGGLPAIGLYNAMNILKEKDAKTAEELKKKMKGIKPPEPRDWKQLKAKLSKSASGVIGTQPPKTPSAATAPVPKPGFNLQGGANKIPGIPSVQAQANERQRNAFSSARVPGIMARNGVGTGMGARMGMGKRASSFEELVMKHVKAFAEEGEGGEPKSFEEVDAYIATRRKDLKAREASAENQQEPRDWKKLQDMLRKGKA
jgi:hypothetical protein